DNERVKVMAVYREMALKKMEALFCNEYTLDWAGDLPYYKLEKPAAHCYLKKSAGAKVLSLESVLDSPGRAPVEVRLEMAGALLEAATLSGGRFDRIFTLPAPRDAALSLRTLAVKLTPFVPGLRLSMSTVRWLEVTPPPQARMQVIDFQPGDEPLLADGW